jgi:hypothetical protein
MSASSDCPGASSKSLGGMTVDLVEMGFAGLYPNSASDPRSEPEACGGRGRLMIPDGSIGEAAWEGEEPPMDACGAGAGKACTHAASRKNAVGKEDLISQ